MKHLLETRGGTTLLWGALWLAVVVTALLTRSYYPIDETRYVTVAWEMWLHGDFLVPHLNGETYSHKPPLLFWLMQLGWWVFGVNEWWPRLVPPLFAFANLLLTARLARLLWPELEMVARVAPTILLATLLWTFYSTMTMFDMLVVFFTLVGMNGIALAWRGHAALGWPLLGVAIGMGVLAKGPVILLHTLPLAVLAPWWVVDRSGRSWLAWYGGVLLAIAVGAAIALAWALPAARTGGAEYADAIFWGQTAGRVAGESAPHHRPIWWYLVLLPALFFPWILWPPLWRGLAGLRALPTSVGVRFTFAWLLPVFVAFSLIRGKQAQYILPLFPAFALLSARALETVRSFGARRDVLMPGGVLVASGAVVALLHGNAHRFHEAAWLDDLSSLWGVALMLIGVCMLCVRTRGPLAESFRWVIVSVLIVVVIHLGLVREANVAYELHGMGRYLAELQARDVPIANLGKYHGQYHFLGRLERPIDVVYGSEALDWARKHADGRVIVYYDDWNPELVRHAEHAQAYRGGGVAVWPANVLVDHPEWLAAWP